MTLTRSDPSVYQVNQGFFRYFKRSFRKIAANPLISFSIPFFMVLMGRWSLLGEVPPPQPYIQDEFSYLLAGDTFASFRVTNPPHPLWQHFETVHELMQPTYMSKYPPMQGMIFAFGQLFFGLPWIGVLLSMAVFCGLLPWAFRVWIPCEWALIGAIIATCKIGIMSYWTESYWGGGAAAIGGALVLGAIKRLSLQPTPQMAVVLTLGEGIMANSRPFEGLVFSLGCGTYLLWKWFGRGRWRKTCPAYPMLIIPGIAVVAIPLLLAMGYYNYRVTGHVMELPYQAFERQYSVWTPFVWQRSPSPEPIYRHEFIRRAWLDYDASVKIFQRRHWLWMHRVNFIDVAKFYFGPLYFIGGYLFIAALLFGRKNREIVGLLLFYYCGTRVMCDIIPHYTAPCAALIYLAVAAALHMCWRFAPWGFSVGKLPVIGALSLFFLITMAFRTGTENRFFYDKSHLAEKRREVLAFLDKQPGHQLVFVHQGALNDPNEIWVFNRADIDASRIIWVDSMTPDEDKKVLDYYNQQHRVVWMLSDDAELTLRPYDHPEAEPVVRIKNPPLQHLPKD